MNRARLLFFLTAMHLQIIANETQSSTLSSVGARTEALFIISNKLKDVREYIQSLKKHLTECHACKPQRYKHWKQRELARYHREFRDVVFPASIRELECLTDYIEKASEKLATDEAIEECEVQKLVEQAVLIKKKIDLESHILELMPSIETQEMDGATARSRKRAQTGFTASPGQQKLPEETIKKAKQSLKKAKKLVGQTNERLYDEMFCLGERTFIDKIALYKV